MKNSIIRILPETNKEFNDRAREATTDSPVCISSKNTTFQLSATLFTDCNLRCKFCYEFSRVTITAEEYDYSSIFENIKAVVDKIKQPNINVSFLGGELLQDKFSDLMYEKYSQLFKLTTEYIKSKNKTYVLGISTNLIHVKRERVLKLCKEHNVELFASFDFKERYSNRKQMQLYIDNLRYYFENGIKITSEMVMTRSNIDAYFSQEYKDIFDQIYEITNGQIILNIFSTNENNQFDNDEVSESRIADFLIDLYEHYPKVSELSDLIDLETNHLAIQTSMCFNTLLYPDKIIWTCCDPRSYTRFLQNRRCFDCKYYQYCNSTVCIRTLAQSKERCYKQIFYDYLVNQKHVTY